MDRNDLLDDLVNRLDSASPRSVLLAGLSGVGKSHLALRALDRCTERGCAVCSISGGMTQQSLPFSSLLLARFTQLQLADGFGNRGRLSRFQPYRDGRRHDFSARERGLNQNTT
jgi:hypothetical protein